MQNSENPETKSEASPRPADPHDDGVLTSVARVVGTALGTVASTASKVLTGDAAEASQTHEQEPTDRPHAATGKSAQTPAQSTIQDAPANRQKQDAKERAEPKQQVPVSTKEAIGKAKAKVKASAETNTGQAVSRQKAKKKAKAKAHRRKIKRSNTNG